MHDEQPPPIHIPPVNPDHPNPALIIFLHGYDDDAESYTGLITHFQTTYPHLSHVSYILPTAPLNHESRARAWYTPRPFSSIPIGRRSEPTTSSQNPGDNDNNEEEDEEDDVAGLLASISYIDTLLTTTTIPASRTIVVGFSQGGAVSLSMGLGLGLGLTSTTSTTPAQSTHTTSLAGASSLSGYLPWSSRMARAISQAPPSATKFFVAHGTRDALLPRWVVRESMERVEGVVGKERVEERWYEGMGHVIAAKEVAEWVDWVGEVVPA